MELFAVVGAVWASRTMFHAGVPMNGGATNASKLAQISGLHDIFLLNCYNNDWCNGLIYARNEGFKEVRFDRLGRFHFPVVNDLTTGTATSPSTLKFFNLDSARSNPDFLSIRFCLLLQLFCSMGYVPVLQ